MEILCLRPLAQAEIERAGGSGFLASLFGNGFRSGPSGRRLAASLAERIAAGGYPAALERTSARRRMAWYRDYQELRRQADWMPDPVDFHHFRDKDGVEVDLVLFSGGRLSGVEVKAGATVRADDFRGLKKLQDAVGSAFAQGVVLYDGEAVIPFGNALHAVPISRLW